MGSENKWVNFWTRISIGSPARVQGEGGSKIDRSDLRAGQDSTSTASCFVRDITGSVSRPQGSQGPSNEIPRPVPPFPIRREVRFSLVTRFMQSRTDCHRRRPWRQTNPEKHPVATVCPRANSKDYCVCPERLPRRVVREQGDNLSGCEEVAWWSCAWWRVLPRLDQSPVLDSQGRWLFPQPAWLIGIRLRDT